MKLVTPSQHLPASMPLTGTESMKNVARSDSGLAGQPSATVPASWQRGFWDPTTQKFYQEVNVGPSSLAAAPSNTVVQSITSAPSVILTTQPPKDTFIKVSPQAKTTIKATVPSPRLESPASSASLDVSDDLAVIANKIEAVVKKEEISKMIEAYQAEGIHGLMNRETLGELLKLAFNPKFRNEMKGLVEAFQNPDVIAAIQDPNRVFGNQEQMEKLQAMFNDEDVKKILVQMRILPPEEPTKMPKSNNRADAVVDEVEDDMPQASGKDAVSPKVRVIKSDELNDLLKELGHQGHKHSRVGNIAEEG